MNAEGAKKLLKELGIDPKLIPLVVESLAEQISKRLEARAKSHGGSNGARQGIVIDDRVVVTKRDENDRPFKCTTTRAQLMADLTEEMKDVVDAVHDLNEHLEEVIEPDDDQDEKNRFSHIRDN